MLIVPQAPYFLRNQRLYHGARLPDEWRSAFFNTELGLLLHSPLAATLSAAFDEYVPRAAYRVTLDARGRLRWQVEGATQVHEVEPGTSWSQRAIAGLLRWAPFEAML